MLTGKFRLGPVKPKDSVKYKITKDTIMSEGSMLFVSLKNLPFCIAKVFSSVCIHLSKNTKDCRNCKRISSN